MLNKMEMGQEMQNNLFKCLNKICEVSVWSLWSPRCEVRNMQDGFFA